MMTYLIIIPLLIVGLSIAVVLTKKKKGRKMESYGIEVTSEKGKVYNLAESRLMLLEQITIPYDVNGSQTFERDIVAVFPVDTMTYSFGKDSKRPKFTINGKTVSWTWVYARNQATNDVSVLIFC